VGSVTELRLRLLQNGVTPLPATVNKAVYLREWRTRPIDETEVRSWAPRTDWPSTAGRTTLTPCLDIDIRDPEAAEAVERLVRDRFDGRGTLLARFGLAPKRLIPFRTSAPFAKRKLRYLDPGGTPHVIEFLGDGQLAIFYGTHEKTGQPYSWHAGRDPLNVPAQEWVSISEIEVDALLTDIDELLTGQFGYTRTPLQDTPGGTKSAVHVTDVDAALAGLCYAGEGGGGNIHDISLGCINALIVQGSAAESAIEEVLAALRIYAATNPLCARWDWERERLRLEKMAFSFINKFSDYADRLPPDLYATRRERRGQGVLEPKLEYDRLHKRWHYPEAPELQDAPPSAPDSRPGEQRFTLVPFCQLRPGTDPGYLVDELIPLRGIVLFWGKRKCLKSFWVYNLSFYIARHTEYRGRSILRGPVVYCAFEGAHGYKKRAEALRRWHNVPETEEVPLFLVPGRANMIKEFPLLIAAVRQQLMGELPRMIVLDTLNKSLVGSESKDVDMAAYIVAAEALRDAFDCVVVIVHHCGYDESHPRGHTSLTGAVDAEFEIVREGMLVTVKNVTMRDGPEGFEIRSAAEVVDVGEDINGKVLSSLVIVPTDAPAATPRKKGRPNVSAPILINSLRRALADRGGMFRPKSEKAAAHAVHEPEVKQRFDDAYPTGEDRPEDAKAAMDEAYRRALNSHARMGRSGRAKILTAGLCSGSRSRRNENHRGTLPTKIPRNAHESQFHRSWSKPHETHPRKCL
jgi:hypothetical protein